MKSKLEITHPAEGLALLTINGRGKSNLADAGLAAELQQVCEDINFDSAIRALIITAPAGKDFCTGLTDGKMQAFSLSGPVAALNCPVIAAIDGQASGIGLELALACDIRLASVNARFSLPYIEKGLLPSDGATQRLPRLVGRGKAMEMMLTGKTLTVKEAMQIGLVNRVLPQKNLLPFAIEMGKEMADKASLALKYCKEAVMEGLDMTLEQGLHLEGDLYFLLHTTADRIEGITAFKEKRKPRFKGK
ncbi:MAG: enoyl-CoA hydratase/isomerase family protein [Dehalococcoidia bacterium]